MKKLILSAIVVCLFASCKKDQVIIDDSAIYISSNMYGVTLQTCNNGRIAFPYSNNGFSTFM